VLKEELMLHSVIVQPVSMMMELAILNVILVLHNVLLVLEELIIVLNVLVTELTQTNVHVKINT
jgi:hypothetical protein